MASDRFKIDYAVSVLRRIYPASNLAGLKAKALEVFQAATETVTLTSAASEGGSQAGEVSFPKVLLGQAIEELIEEYDPASAAPSGPGMLSPDWRFCSPV